MTQHELLVELAKFRNDSKGLNFRERFILDKLIKELGKRELSPARLNELEKLYHKMIAEYQKVGKK